MIAEACIVSRAQKPGLLKNGVYVLRCHGESENEIHLKMFVQLSVIFWLFLKLNIFVIYNHEKSLKLS